jgi:hypothetical protein
MTMAKARTTETEVQSVPAPVQPSLTGLASVPQAVSGTFPLAAGGRAVQIEIPLTGHLPPTEFVLHVDCKLTPEQSTVARRIAQQLDFQNASLKNGQRIVNVHGALKWILEQIAKQLK